jgi:hypothetical protein
LFFDASRAIKTADCLAILLEFAVPVALVVLLLDITLIYHAAKTGRLQPWAFIILMVPLIGSLAYIVVELVPEWLGSPDAQKVRRRVANRLDPEKQYRELSDQLATADTVANRAALAAECVNVARFGEAEQHYDHILKGPLGHEPVYMFRKAEAQFSQHHPAEAILTLDELQRTWPDYHSPEAHLLYARALAGAGRTEEALEEFHAVTGYFPGAEARVRYGLLLKLVGRTTEAKVVFTELIIQMKRAPRHVRQAQAEWLSIAEKQLSV